MSIQQVLNKHWTRVLLSKVVQPIEVGPSSQCPEPLPFIEMDK